MNKQTVQFGDNSNVGGGGMNGGMVQNNNLPMQNVQMGDVNLNMQQVGG